ncbi:hypothetical protein EV361DRAFT_667040 [Lentinula raphanica]|nr:hypothetical protein EV361DRAFT_667040 [Lentinula raphanica]
MDATHSYNPSSTQKGQNIDPSEIHDLPYQSATQTRFLPPIDDLDDNSEDDDDDMPPGIMVDDLPILPPPVMFTHDNADEGVPPPGIMLNDNGLDFHDRNQGEANEEGRLPPHSGSSAYTETSGNINEPTSESGTPDARTGPLTFNYTFLPDMSLATASDGSSGTGITDVASSFGEYNSGGATDHPMESTTRTDYDSGSIQSVAYPAYPITSYPPTSYHRIPRPPNAFILFRSAFIRSRKISSDIEGNHSTLSKIIGRLWRNLPPDERAEWEARARLAQEEHRQRYPDWRFSPAGGGGVSGRRRGNRGRGRGRGRGRLKAGQGGRTSGSGASAGDDSAEAGPPLKQDKGKGKEREVDSDAGVDDMSSMGSDQAGSGQDTRAVVQVDSSAWPIVRGASSSHAESSKRVLHRSTTSEIIQDSSSDFDSRLHSTSSLTMYPRSLSPQERDDPAPLGDTLALGPQESTSSNPSVSSSTLSPIDEQKKYYSSLVSASHVNPDKSQEREGEPQAPQEQTHNADSHSSLSLREVSSVKKEADARVDAIADMLIRGYEGKALEAAVQQWETAGRKESDRRMLDSKGRKDKDQRDNGKKGKTKEAETNPIEDTVGQEHALEEGFRPNIEVSVLRERQIGSEIAVREQGQNENRPGHTHDLQSSDLHVGEDAFPEGHDWFTDYNSGPTALLDSVQSTYLRCLFSSVLAHQLLCSTASRSSSSNETERERGRAGGEWGLFNTVDATAGPEHFASPNALFPTSIPITRVFLKRSLSEPAAPRPTRPRLQLPTEENIETAEKDGRDEGGVRTEYHEGYPQFGLDPTLSMAHSIHPFQSHEELPTETSRPPEDTVYPSLSFWHLSSSDFSGGRYALRRHHANSYPAVTPGSARGRSGYPMSPHPNPIPTYTTSLAPPQVLVRRSEDTPAVVFCVSNDFI